jgi:hypothetical protein
MWPRPPAQRLEAVADLLGGGVLAGDAHDGLCVLRSDAARAPLALEELLEVPQELRESGCVLAGGEHIADEAFDEGVQGEQEQALVGA